ncbi:MAG: alpha/beta hydrolase [Rhodospirillales bacterium]|nr:alpha/beta hydrolase [Rhodospirillales bacterium]
MADSDAPPFAERHYTSQDGLRLYFRDYGDARARAVPVLCLCGITRNSKDFHRLASTLASERRVICPDYRGRGRSAYDPDWRNYHPRTYLDDVRHLLVSLNVHGVAVIGVSLGGVLAMAMGAAMPTVLKGALLDDIGPAVPAAALAPIIAHMRDAKPLPSLAAAADRLRTMFPHLPAKTDADWLGIAAATYREEADGTFRCDWDPAIVRPLLQRLPRATLWPLFRSLRRIPVLAVRGALSEILTEETFRRMADEMPGLMRVTVPGVGHVPSLNEPESTDAIRRWLRAVDETAKNVTPANAGVQTS